MKRKMFAGTTSVALPVYVSDTSATTSGTGLSGLVYNSSGLVAEYRRQGQSTWTTITLAAGTLGTFVSGGFVVDGALAGAYEFCPPDAALASGARWVAIRLRGAANMGAVLVEIELDAVNYQDAAALGLSRLDAAVSTRSTYAGADTAGTTTLLTRVPGNLTIASGKVAATLAAADVSGNLPAALNPAQTGWTVRDVSAVADASLTLSDLLVSAMAGAVGDKAVSGTAFTIKTPGTATTVATKTLDSGTAPTSST